MKFEETITKIILENTDLELDDLMSDSSLESLGLDSLDMVTIIYEVEEIYSVEIEEEDMNGIENYGEFVGKLHSFVQNKD